MYLSIFNSFRVIRCLNQCVSPKSLFLPHFCFHWGCPWGKHAKCCINGKRIRCLQIVSLHVPIYYYLTIYIIFFYITVSETERDIGKNNGRKAGFFIPPLHSMPPLRGFSSEYRHPLWYVKTRMVSLPDGEKISKICLFVLT